MRVNKPSSSSRKPATSIADRSSGAGKGQTRLDGFLASKPIMLPRPDSMLPPLDATDERSFALPVASNTEQFAAAELAGAQEKEVSQIRRKLFKSNSSEEDSHDSGGGCIGRSACTGDGGPGRVLPNDRSGSQGAGRDYVSLPPFSSLAGESIATPDRVTISLLTPDPADGEAGCWEDGIHPSDLERRYVAEGISPADAAMDAVHAVLHQPGFVDEECTGKHASPSRGASRLQQVVVASVIDFITPPTTGRVGGSSVCEGLGDKVEFSSVTGVVSSKAAAVFELTTPAAVTASARRLLTPQTYIDLTLSGT